jgi:hypothetical protein
METQTLTIGPFDFTVETAGPPSGAPVLLLHGFPQNRRMWRYQLEALAAVRLDFAVLRPINAAIQQVRVRSKTNPMQATYSPPTRWL